jgi:hypothetical protein
MLEVYSDDLDECSAGLRDTATYHTAQHTLSSKAYGHEAQRCMSARSVHHPQMTTASFFSKGSIAYQTGSKRAMAMKMSS